MIEINRETKVGDIISLIKGPYFGLCNGYDKDVAAWIEQNCQEYDGNAEKILKQVLKLCPRDKAVSPTIAAILGLIARKPKRFTKDEYAYKALLSFREKAPSVWKSFLKNVEEVNGHEDWLLLAKDLGYDGPRDYRDTEHYDYVMMMLEKTADQRD